MKASVPVVLRGNTAVPTLELIVQSGAIAFRARGSVQKRDKDAEGEQVEQEGSESEDDSVSKKGDKEDKEAEVYLRPRSDARSSA